MKSYKFLLLTFLAFTLTSCKVISGIFQAGVWVGVLVVVAVIALIGWLLSLIFKKK